MAYTNIDDPSAYFQTALYTGNGTADTSITNDGNSNLQPDWIWIKRRDGGADHNSFDSSRGTGKHLAQNQTQAEQTVNGVTAFESDGFELSTNGDSNFNGATFVAWQWKANGGTTTSVSASGSGANCINASTHQVNQDAGFSIITYTGRADEITVHEQTNLTHGLGVAPDLTIMKKRDGTGDWIVMGKHITTSSAYSANEHLHLNTADGVSDAEYTGYIAPTSTYIYLGDALVNDTGDDYVCYAFASKQGYSQFGSYIGNGVANDGPFVYLGFKPAFVIIKSLAATGAHYLWDLKRSPYNGMYNTINAAEVDAETANTIMTIDVVSNGFKIMNTGSNNGTNQSGTKYVYYAFAENPFTTSTGIPTTAR